jgi:hypothetical protein
MYVMSNTERNIETKQKNNQTEQQTDYLMIYLNADINSQLTRLMKGRRCMNNKKTLTIQNILFGALTKHHKLFYVNDIYFEK